MSKEAMKLETVYETIIQWDEGGGKRSRRELARRIVALAEPEQEPEHIVHSNGRYSPLLTHMMNKRVKSNLKQVIELYDSPDQPAPPPECKTEAEKTAYAFGWFKALESVREKPAQQEQGDSICQEDDGCPTELAVLQRFWRGQSIPYEHYPTWCKPAPVPEPAQQEPVAWEQFYPDMGKPELAYLPPTESPENACYVPSQRTWVGLTKLKEKNT